MADWKLKHFRRDELLFNQLQSFRILEYFGIEPGITANQFTDQDRSFAQALLVAAVDSSYAKGFIHAIFDVFCMTPVTSPDDIAELVKEFLEKTAEHWFEHATKADLREAKIYESVRLRIAQLARSPWAIRRQTGELTY